MYKSAAIVGIFAALSLSAAEAASVTPKGGSVYVNTGGGYVEVKDTTGVPAAAKVMISPGGSALVTYSEKCSVKLASGVWSVLEQAPCEEGVALIDYSGRMNQEAPPTGGGVDATTLVVGGVLVGAGVAAAIILLEEDDDKSASP